MKDSETFWILFVLLERCYFSTRTVETDGLGGLLGALSPELWVDGLPADKAMLDDWGALPDTGSPAQAAMLHRIGLFIDHYADGFAFSAKAVRRWLADLTPGQYDDARREAAQRRAVWQDRRRK